MEDDEKNLSHQVIPPEQKEQIDKQNFDNIVQFTMEQGFSSIHPLGGISKKINESHIDKILENKEKESQRQFQEKREEKIYNGIVYFTAIVAVIILTFFLVDKSQSQLAEKIITII